MRTSTIFLLLAAAAWPAAATPFNVSGDGTTIKDALTAAQDGDTIAIAPGVHVVHDVLTVTKHVTIKAATTSPTSLQTNDVLFLIETGGGSGQVTIQGLDLSPAPQVAGTGLVWFSDNHTRIVDCTFSGFAAAIVASNDAAAAAPNTLSIVNSTLDSNTWGVIVDGEAGSTLVPFTVQVVSSTIVNGQYAAIVAQNTAAFATVVVKNSILTANPGIDGALFDVDPGQLTLQGVNLIGDPRGNPSAAGAMTGDPVLAALDFNGGSSRSLLPLEGSRVTGVIAQATDETGAPIFADQRGVPRATPTSIGAVDPGPERVELNPGGASIGAIASAVNGHTDQDIAGLATMLSNGFGQLAGAVAALGSPAQAGVVGDASSAGSTTLFGAVKSANASLAAVAQGVSAANGALGSIGASVSSTNAAVAALNAGVAAGMTTLTNLATGRPMLVPVAVVQRLASDLVANNALPVQAVLPLARGGQLEWMLAIVHQDYLSLVALVGATAVSNASNFIAAGDQSFEQGQFSAAAISYAKAERALRAAVP